MSKITFKDFYRPTPYNTETKNQIWMSQIADSHDNWCNCNQPFAHLLASIFPPGHTDRTQTINFILARDYRAQCLSGGADAENSGMAGQDSIKKEDSEKENKPEDIPEDDLDALLAAVAEEKER